MDYILKEGRVEISSKTEELMQVILDSYQSGIELTTVNLWIPSTRSRSSCF